MLNELTFPYYEGRGTNKDISRMPHSIFAGQVTCPRLPSCQVVDELFYPRSLTPEAKLLATMPPSCEGGKANAVVEVKVLGNQRASLKGVDILYYVQSLSELVVISKT